MTQKFRWLSALVLLLAVGAATVRAEEEEAPAPSRPTAELLPAPLPVAVAAPGMWSFFAPMPFPCPCPAPLTPAAFVSYGDGCACPNCPCPNCPLCSTPQATTPDGEYVVEMKLVEAGDDDEADQVIAHPRICVLEGQTGTVQTANAGSKEQSTLQMQATLSKLDVGAVLNLRVEQASSFTPGNNVLQSHANTTQHQLPIQFGKATKLALTHDSDGACTSWVEVTVTKVETEKRMMKTATVGCCLLSKARVCEEEEEEATPAGANDFVDFLQGFFELAAETASDLTGASASEEPAVTNAVYLQHPPLYCPEMTAGTTCPQTCQAPSCCTSSACTQCVATATVKPAITHVRIHTSNGRKCLEMTWGDKQWKAVADRVTIHGSVLEMEGYEAESSDGSARCSGSTISMTLDKSNVEIELGD